ncbi:serine/threonine-protein phosphatase [Cellulomonas iranensis]|uniref:PP2C family protein-serine/threonine phosphatase n=1 Tax=Cellulomonas iranensis TaxID=76862 RepID=UPI001CF5A176|nr:PP2C family protein-serine/threonine phosphatase [Cellulomonas iranensis]UCN14664.1 serine/threonine-protein phosphatase [Cellulomonas iranensis]
MTTGTPDAPEIMDALVTALDRLHALRLLASVLDRALDPTQARARLLAIAADLTDADVVAVLGPDDVRAADPDAATGVVARAAAAAAATAPGRVAVLDGGSTVVQVPAEPDDDLRGVVVSRTAGPPFGTGELDLVDVVVATAVMARTIWRLHATAVERAAVAREHEAASTVAQAVLAPAPPVVPGLDVAARSVPAHVAGGDLYAFAERDGGLWFAVGDVAGKGLPAAVVMSRVIAECLAAFTSVESGDVEAATQRVDRDVHDWLVDIRRFVTLAVGHVDPASGVARVCNAGHSPVLLGAGGRVTPLRATSPPLGVLPGLAHAVREVRMAPGDTLWVGSDGLVEQEDATGGMLGYDRFAALCARWSRGTAADGLAAVLDAVAAHGRGVAQSDDRTLVVVRREAWA